MGAITEGIIYTRDAETGEWTKTFDNWPSNRRRAQIGSYDEKPFWKNYGRQEAIDIIENAIAKKQTGEHYRFFVVPGKESTTEEKEKFAQLRTKKQVERGEAEPAESYISPEEA